MIKKSDNFLIVFLEMELKRQKMYVVELKDLMRVQGDQLKLLEKEVQLLKGANINVDKNNITSKKDVDSSHNVTNDLPITS